MARSKRRESTESLVEKAAGGDRQATAELIVRYQRFLDAYTRMRVGDTLLEKLEIDDVRQEVLLAVCRSIPGLRWRDEESFRKWLLVVAEHAIAGLGRHFERRKRGGGIRYVSIHEDANLRRGVEPAVVPEPVAGKKVEAEEKLERVRRALWALSEAHRKIICLRVLAGLSNKESARHMERSAAATNVLFSRAKKQLRRVLSLVDGAGTAPAPPLQDLEAVLGIFGDAVPPQCGEPPPAAADES